MAAIGPALGTVAAPWDSIVGHHRAVELLRRNLRAGRIGHAYLFLGLPNLGKGTLALLFAQALVCTAPAAALRPCARCSACQRARRGQHPDVQVVGVLAEGNRGRQRKEISIDQIRELKHSAGLSPYEAAYKVFLLDGAERLTEEAANCLLKTLEEPPPSVVLLLLATDDTLLPPTLASRCQRIHLRPAERGELEDALAERGLERAQARLLAKLSQGRAGRALRWASGGAPLEARARALAAAARLLTSGRQERLATASQLAARFSREREGVFEVLDFWAQWWRDVLVYKAGSAELVVNEDRLEEVDALAGRTGWATVRGIIGGIEQTRAYLQSNVNARLALESFLLGLPADTHGLPPADV